MMNKRAVNVLMENLVYILLVIVFIAIMFFVITRAGSQATLYEQVGAKKIALMIDKASPGMEITLVMEEEYEIARKNRYRGKIVNIDNNMLRMNILDSVTKKFVEDKKDLIKTLENEKDSGRELLSLWNILTRVARSVMKRPSWYFINGAP